MVGNMKHLTLKSLLFIGLLLVPASVYADQLTVGFSYAKPPFVFAEKSGDTSVTNGIELDIMRQALAVKGHTFKPRYISYKRLAYELGTKRIDAAATIQPENKEFFYSDQYVYFHNFAISKRPSKLAIRSLSDLTGKRLAAWQGAAHDLGPDFEAVTKKATLYREFASQKQQVFLFLKDRLNVLIIDGNIFKYWAGVHGVDVADFEFNPIFGDRTTFTVGFSSKRLRDDFNEGLRAIRKTGAYDEIYQRYTGQ